MAHTRDDGEVSGFGERERESNDLDYSGKDLTSMITIKNNDLVFFGSEEQ